MTNNNSTKSGAKSDKNKKIAIAIGVVATVILAVILLIIFVLRDNNSDTNTPQISSSDILPSHNQETKPDVSDPDYVDENGILIHKPWGDTDFATAYPHAFDSANYSASIRTTIWPAKMPNGTFLVHPAGKYSNPNLRINETTEDTLIFPFTILVQNTSSKNEDIQVRFYAPIGVVHSKEVYMLTETGSTLMSGSDSGTKFSSLSPNARGIVHGYIKVYGYTGQSVEELTAEWGESFVLTVTAKIFSGSVPQGDIPLVVYKIVEGNQFANGGIPTLQEISSTN